MVYLHCNKQHEPNLQWKENGDQYKMIREIKVLRLRQEHETTNKQTNKEIKKQTKSFLEETTVAALHMIWPLFLHTFSCASSSTCWTRFSRCLTIVFCVSTSCCKDWKKKGQMKSNLVNIIEEFNCVLADKRLGRKNQLSCFNMASLTTRIKT